MIRQIKIVPALTALLLTACSEGLPIQTGSPIYPDYTDVTIPVGIAPLNFCYTEAGPAKTTFSTNGTSISIKGRKVRISPARWQKILKAAVATGGSIHVSSSRDIPDWEIHVSNDPIEWGICYRLIAPGYEVHSKMGIYERELSSYKQHTLIDNTQFLGCVNCHEFNRNRSNDLTLHIRGDHSATLLCFDGRIDAYNTKTDSTIGFCVYPYWHPSGNFIAYSVNTTRQGFHEQPDKLIEVYDYASDVLVYNVRSNKLTKFPNLSRENIWETFPSFSPDGTTLYFCAASAKKIPEEMETIRYNLCKVSFDPETATIGSQIDTLVHAEKFGKSISFPKPSYDGRFIMFTLSDYGNFSIWHHEADLWILDLESMEIRPLDKANSCDTESYHNWSANSRWFIFSSRRDDGLFTRPYICHIDGNGKEAKPFMLPQQDPLEYYSESFLSFNVPEFINGPVRFDSKAAARKINSGDRGQFAQ